MHDVFISYATPDRTVAEAACQALEAAGVKVWIAPRDVYEGQPYAECIVRALREAKLLVLIFSSHSNTSGMVLRELECAASLAKPLLPVRIEDVSPTDEMKFFVGREHWLDAREGADHLRRLVEAVRRITTPDGAGTPAAREGDAPNAAAGHAPGPARAAPGSGATGRWAFIAGGAAVACVAIAAMVVLLKWGPAGDAHTDESADHSEGDQAAPEEPPDVSDLRQITADVSQRGTVLVSGVVLNEPEREALISRIGALAGSWKVDATAVTVNAAAVARLLQQRLREEGFEGAIVREYAGTNKGPSVLRIEIKKAEGYGPDEAREMSREYVSDDAPYVTIVPD